MSIKACRCSYQTSSYPVKLQATKALCFIYNFLYQILFFLRLVSRSSCSRMPTAIRNIKHHPGNILSLPGQPSLPGKPSLPGQPNLPGKPDQLRQAGKLQQPGQPDLPARPTGPFQQNQPSQPARLARLATPATPANLNGSSQQAKSATSTWHLDTQRHLPELVV